MPWATNDRIGTDPIDGGIEITEQQYQDAIAGMLAGKLVSIDGGFAVVAPPAPAAPEEQQQPLPLTADVAKAQIITSIDGATASIINAYPTAERLGWDAKAAEATAVLAAGAGATLAMAPLLTTECAAEYGAADDATRLAQLAAKTQTVLDKAAAWGQLMATLSGLRGKAFAAIDAAGNDAEALRAAVDAASAEIAATATAQ